MIIIVKIALWLHYDFKSHYDFKYLHYDFKYPSTMILIPCTMILILSHIYDLQSAQVHMHVTVVYCVEHSVNHRCGIELKS